MTKACPVLTETEIKLNDIVSRAKVSVLDKVMAALAEAEQAAIEGFEGNTLGAAPPPLVYFASALHQDMYCLMCGANPKTLEGGDPQIAIEVIRNSQNIARHYWGADTRVDDPALARKPAVSLSPTDGN